MKTSDNVSTLPALPNSTVIFTHCHCLTPSLSVYTKYKLHGCFRVCLVFTPSTPDHEKGTMSKKALRGPFSSCHLKQSLACNLACQIACLLQNLEFITLYPNGKKTCLFEESRNARQYFKQLNKRVRDGLEANYREYPQTLGKGSSYSPFSCTFPLTILPASGYRDILLYVRVINNTSVPIPVN